MRASEMKKLVGKAIRFRAVGRVFDKRTGVVEEVVRQNVRIDGDWFWFGANPDITDIKVIEDADGDQSR